MSTTLHPLDELSAYLDGALGPGDRAAVEAHLDGCASCRARLAELRTTTALLRALPDPLPSRRLVPRIAAAPAWLAPLRTLATLASGVSVFLFMASAILSNITFLASGSASTTSALAPAAGNAPAASAGTARDSVTGPVPTPAPPAAAQKTQGSPSPNEAFSVSSVAPTVAQQAPTPAEQTAPVRNVGPSPWLWLVLAIVTGAIALALQRRLRSV